MASAVPYDLLTPREVAEVMRVSTMTVYRLIKSGELPAIRVGKHLRIRGNDVVTFLDARVVHASSFDPASEPAHEPRHEPAPGKEGGTWPAA